jgi:hypothetical protein
MNISTETTITDSMYEEHIPNVLPYLKELKETFRRQDFKFTKQQQEEYDLLLTTRRARVKQFHEKGLVSKGGLRPREEQQEEG